MRKKNVIVVMLILVAVMAIGYGAFSTTLTINGTANISSSWEVVFTEIKQLSKTDGVTIKTAPSASGTTATFDVDLTSPGDAIEYQIKVENKGSIDAKIESITATETGSDAIVFEISDIKEGQTLLKQATKTFKVKISYKDSITSQPNITTNKLMVSINFVQLVGSSTEGEAPTLVTEKLAARILKDNIAYADNIRSPYVNSDTGIDFSQVASAENGQGLYYTNKNTDGGKTTYYFRGDVENNYVTIGEDVYSSKGVCKSKFEVAPSNVVVFDEITSESECNNIGICYDRGNGDHTIATEEECRQKNIDEGMPADNGRYLYQQGGIWTRELVSEAPKFRIIRINEDGSVRIMSTDYIEDEQYKYIEFYDDSQYTLGFKSHLQTWYDSNLSSYSSNLISNNFCYDDSVRTSGGGTPDSTTSYYYGAYDRLMNNKTPKFGCSVAKDGGYAGLITADEVAYAGGVYGKPITGYLSGFNDIEGYNIDWMIGSPWVGFSWIDFPYEWTIGVGKLLGVVPDDIIVEKQTNDSNRIRLHPVINVKGDVKVTKGNGTSSNPYILDLS